MGHSLLIVFQFVVWVVQSLVLLHLGQFFAFLLDVALQILAFLLLLRQLGLIDGSLNESQKFVELFLSVVYEFREFTPLGVRALAPLPHSSGKYFAVVRFDGLVAGLQLLFLVAEGH